MPMHNEEKHVDGAIARVPPFVDSIVAVDDGSSDKTCARLFEIREPRLVVLRHTCNRGVGAATKTGYRHSLQAGADLIAVMDGDGQMDGLDLAGLLDQAIAGADYVKGNRFVESGTICSMPIGRYIGNRVLSWLTRRAAGFGGLLDAQCGYTVICRSGLNRMRFDELYDRYGFPNEMLFEACRVGLRVASAPVRTVYGSEVSGINPLTSVPVIFYLIARSYLRRRLFWPSPRLVPESEAGSVE
jgi:glycosyltransferase involved in cell wall biosynthesis